MRAGDTSPTTEEMIKIVEEMPQVPAGKTEEIKIPGGSLTMVVIPGGLFDMGSDKGKENEQPVHRVTVPPFKLSKYEITIAQWSVCWREEACKRLARFPRGTDRTHPIQHVTYDAVTRQYIPWLNKKTGRSFRLPSEAEWEYAARAGSTTAYSWGEEIHGSLASCYACDTHYTRPVRAYSANAFGLHNMHGNASEWVRDCWHSSYSSIFGGAPHDGSAWTGGMCNQFVLRGGSNGSGAENIRSAARSGVSRRERISNVGFRLAHDLDVKTQ